MAEQSEIEDFIEKFRAQFEEEDREEEIQELGPEAILHKPLTNDELVSTIDGVCGAATQAV